MLRTLSIRNVVLIERLEIAFKPGLCVLTGETGAGKSILLDALGLALGARAEAGLVRAAAAGEDPPVASVAAGFELPAGHPVLAGIEAQGLPAPAAGDPLILRRSLTAEGRSRAFVQDQPVAVQTLRGIGAGLVDVVGQFARLELAGGAAQRAALDGFAGLDGARTRTEAAWRAWRGAEAALAEAKDAAAGAVREESWLRHSVEEIDALAPETGEAAALEAQRRRLQHAERLREAVGEAAAALDDADGAQSRLGAAHRALARRAGLAEGALDPVLEALDRALAEAAEARSALDGAARDLTADPERLDDAERRLFALRALARKHGVEADGLAGLRETLAARLSLVEDRAGALAELEAEAGRAKSDYGAAAAALSAARAGAAAELDRAVAGELAPLRLGAARFATAVEALPEARWGPEGADRVEFTAATQPGAAPARLTRVASGGELARFLLALKVVLARAEAVPTLVFDEVDAGIGGAVATAVGERLRRLGGMVQVLVVTHSPQVAAVGDAHWRVRRAAREGGGAGAPATTVDELDESGRREEVARMLAGARVTERARAAADSLIEAAAP